MNFFFVLFCDSSKVLFFVDESRLDILYYRIKSTCLSVSTYLSPVQNKSLHPVSDSIPVQATDLIERSVRW